MPVVITDFTNKTWAVESPDDEYIHVGYAGHGGPRLVDALDFISIRGKQFDKFVKNRREQETKADAKKRRVSAASVR